MSLLITSNLWILSAALRKISCIHHTLLNTRVSATALHSFARWFVNLCVSFLIVWVSSHQHTVCSISHWNYFINQYFIFGFFTKIKLGNMLYVFGFEAKRRSNATTHRLFSKRQSIRDWATSIVGPSCRAALHAKMCFANLGNATLLMGGLHKLVDAAQLAECKWTFFQRFCCDCFGEF